MTTIEATNIMDHWLTPHVSSETEGESDTESKVSWEGDTSTPRISSIIFTT